MTFKSILNRFFPEDSYDEGGWSTTERQETEEKQRPMHEDTPNYKPQSLRHQSSSRLPLNKRIEMAATEADAILASINNSENSISDES